MRSPSRRALSLFFCALTAAAMPSAVSAAEPIALRSQTVRVEIDGRFAKTTIEQVWVNYTDRQQEASYTFSLPPGAAVTDLAMWVGGLRSPAEIHPRVAAEQIYRQIRDQKRDPALLVYQGEGTWNLSIFPIPEQGTQKVQIVCTQLLRTKDGQIAYEGPTSWSSNFGGRTLKAGDFDFSATIRAEGGIKDLTAVKNSMGVQKLSGGGLHVGFRSEALDISAPVSFSFVPVNPLAETVVFTEKGQQYFASALPRPKFLDQSKPLSRDYVLVIDTSGSMSGKAFQAAMKAAGDVLDRVDDHDRIAIVAAGADATLWKDKFVAADKANLAEAREFVKGLKAQGGTDLAAALRASGSFQADAARRIDIVVITDGRDQVGAKPDPRDADESPATAPAGKVPTSAPAMNKNLPGMMPANCHVFALILGEDDSRLSTLAGLSGGRALQIMPDAGGAVADTVNELIKNSRQAVVESSNIKLAASEKDVSEFCFTAPRADLDDFVVAGRLGKDAPTEFVVTVAGAVEGKDVEQKFTVKLPKSAGGAEAPTQGNEIVRLVWAQLRAELLWHDMQNEKAQLRDLDALLKLSKSMHLVTPATAFLVLESDEDYICRGIRRQTCTLSLGQSYADREEGLAEFQEALSRNTTLDDGQKVTALRNQMREFVRTGDYDAAVSTFQAVADRVSLTLDEQAEFALLKEFAALRTTIEIRKEREKASGELLAHSAPWQESLLPTGVGELVPLGSTPRPRPIVSSNSSLPLEEQKVFEKLRTKIPKAQFNKTPFKDVVEIIRQWSDVNVHVNWQALTGPGVTQDTEVTLNATDITVQKLLEIVLNDLGTTAKLGYTTSGGVLSISSKDELAKTPVIRIYDVRDLLAVVPQQNLYPRMLYRLRQEGIFGQCSTGGGIFGDDTFGDNFESNSGSGSDSGRRTITIDGTPASLDQPGIRTFDVRDLIVRVPNFTGPIVSFSSISNGGEDNLMRSSEPSNRLKDLIRMTIDKESWGPPSGSGPGSLDYFSGVFIVMQTDENHQAIAKLLDQVREFFQNTPAVLPVTTTFSDSEAMFTIDARVSRWVRDLLARAEQGKLSKFSSVITAKSGDKTFARIGGVWFDTSLGQSTTIQPVAPTPAMLSALYEARPSLREDFALGPYVIVAVSEKFGVCLDSKGAVKPDDEAFKKLLAAMAK